MDAAPDYAADMTTEVPRQFLSLLVLLAVNYQIQEYIFFDEPCSDGRNVHCAAGSVVMRERWWGSRLSSKWFCEGVGATYILPHKLKKELHLLFSSGNSGWKEKKGQER